MWPFEVWTDHKARLCAQVCGVDTPLTRRNLQQNIARLRSCAAHRVKVKLRASTPRSVQDAAKKLVPKPAIITVELFDLYVIPIRIKLFGEDLRECRIATLTHFSRRMNNRDRAIGSNR